MRQRLRLPSRLLLILLGAMAVSAQGEARGRGAQEAGTLFTGERVFAGFDGRRREALARQRAPSAILVVGGRVVAIGAVAELASTEAGRRARRVDLPGGFIYPGFQDAHGGLERLGRDLEHVDLAQCESVGDLIQRLQAGAAALPAGRWVQASGWDSAQLSGASEEGRAALAAAVSRAMPDHPVLLREVSGDGLLLNVAGWAQCGLVRGGAGAKDATPSGGWLRGEAAQRALATLQAPTMKERARRVLRGQEVLLRAGFTCVHVSDLDADMARTLAALRADGRLRIRVVGYLDAKIEASPEDWSRWERDPSGADRFELVGVSLGLDGSLATRGAALERAYADDPGGRGAVSVGFATASDLVTQAARLGRQPALRCSGDRAVSLALDIYARTSADFPALIGLRPRLEGLDLGSRTERGRLRSLGVVSSVQPARLGRQTGWAAERLGEGRVLGLQPWRSLLAAGSQPLALGSGSPAVEADPRVTFFTAVSRRAVAAPKTSGFLPGQSLTANEALGGMTSGAAFAATQEDRRGLLARGYGGDLTVLDMDLTQLGSGDAGRALKATVLMTVVNGEILHDAR
ncbi:MAG: amidohydrolase family protein [Planctomycetota bacterium]|nr:amidohydrolase family protein [Planctomycetota bacterium]